MRFNVKYKEKYACYSSIVDFFIVELKSLEDYEKWRDKEYGNSKEPLEQANKKTIEDCVADMKITQSKREILDNLLEIGLSREEALELIKCN